MNAFNGRTEQTKTEYILVKATKASGKRCCTQASDRKCEMLSPAAAGLNELANREEEKLLFAW
jgi:hypothetical protein